jgi:prepilin-type N-terminal cleavage/methylation domain-containing protein
MKYNVRHIEGFTLIEVSVLVVIIGILAAIAYGAPISIQKTSRDQERADDVASFARRLEQAYRGQEAGAPSYPSTTEMTTAVANNSGFVTKLDPDVLKAPGATSASFIPATSASMTTPAASGEPTASHYVYQPLKADDTLCTGDSITIQTNNCVRFFIYYRTEKDNVIKKEVSEHQQ